MKFKETLLQGTLVKRYKRFFVDIKHQNKVITAHCPNTGSMAGLLIKGNKVLFSHSTDPNRKLKYTLQIIKEKNSFVGVNTLISNKENMSYKRNLGVKKFQSDLIAFLDSDAYPHKNWLKIADGFLSKKINANTIYAEMGTILITTNSIENTLHSCCNK